MPVIRIDDDPLHNLSYTHLARLQLAYDDLDKLITKYNINGNDSLFFPSVDFYSLVALFQMRDRLLAIGNPSIFLRYIGVMEYATHHYRKPLDLQMIIIKSLADAGHRICLSAETPRYADYLAARCGLNFDVTPTYPGGQSAKPPPTAPYFMVSCPGSARSDKGFFQLREIFQRVRQRDAKLKIRFTTQILPDRSVFDSISYIRQIYAIPGVTLLPGQISKNDTEELYSNSNLIILPYDSNTYRYRGSAVMMEGIAAGRPILCLQNSAFADQVLFFNLGHICSNLQEMSEKIIEMSGEDYNMVYARTTQSRYRIVNDVDSSYQRWFAYHA